ncbi:MAG: hypothetical protein ACREXM_05540 [Gammaproteobacteria bacterium]
MQSDKRNTRVKYIVLCALASVSMAAIAGDRSAISVYGYSTDQGTSTKSMAGAMASIAISHRLTKMLATSRTEDFMAAASRVAPTRGIPNRPIIPLLPTVDINRRITPATLKVFTTATIKGSIIRASPGTAQGSVIGARGTEKGHRQ